MKTKHLKLISVIIVSVYFLYYTSTYTKWHFIDNVNLIFHEAGHSIFSFFGEFINILAGSTFQVALPLFFTIYFFRNSQKISSALCMQWVGQNLLNVSVYAGDARTMNLDLLGGDGVGHDWNYLLRTLGLLNQTDTVASIIYIIGVTTVSIGIALALFYSIQEIQKKDEYRV